MTILDEIVAAKRLELERHKAEVTLVDLEQRAAGQPPPLNLSGALWADRVTLIAEVKKASPSKGLLVPDFDPVSIATTYARHGAAAISVVTDAHFEGDLNHLSAVKQAVAPFRIPVMRKDFIFDPYQIYEARAYGADALLLIVAILSSQQLTELLALSRQLHVQCLVEVHNEDQLQEAVEVGAEIIGINNRDLRTFHTDMAATERLAPLVPRGKVIVSESGINTPEHMMQLRRMRVNAALVGEALVTAPDIGAKVRELSGRTVEAATTSGDA